MFKEDDDVMENAFEEDVFEDGERHPYPPERFQECQCNRDCDRPYDYPYNYPFNYQRNRYCGCRFCCYGPRGPRGPRGPEGPRGPRGPEGRPGADGEMEGFVYVYHLAEGCVPTDCPIVFDGGVVPPVPKGGISVPNDTTIKLCEAGVYEALYHVMPVQEDRTVRLTLNGKELPGSRTSNHTSGAVIECKMMFTVDKCDLPATIQLVNWHDCPITYEAHTPLDVTAMLSIKKLSESRDRHHG